VPHRRQHPHRPRCHPCRQRLRGPGTTLIGLGAKLLPASPSETTAPSPPAPWSHATSPTTPGSPASLPAKPL
jgi:hypothetical protein